MSTEEAVIRLFRARKTLCQMLKDRGYVVSEAQLNETKDEFIQLFEENERNRERMIIYCQRKNDPNDKILGFFADTTKKVGIQPIKKLTEKMESHGINRAILITLHPLTPFAKEAVAETAPKNIIEVFEESELLVNITHHELVPKHKPLSEEEKRTLLERYTVKESQLPRIQMNDPVARYLGLHRGQVVKIIRPSETAGRYVTYRICL